MEFESEQLDRAYSFILREIIARGHAPVYTELANEFDLDQETGRALWREVVNGEYHSSWLEEGTDYIVSFAPFNNLPTHYRVTVDGEQRWFAQCGFEALAVRWLFPGQLVRIDSLCLHCGEPLGLEFRDEDVLLVDPPEMVGYSASETANMSPIDHSWRCARKNLFVDGDHAREWIDWDPEYESELQPVSYWINRFSREFARSRDRRDYISWRIETHRS